MTDTYIDETDESGVRISLDDWLTKTRELRLHNPAAYFWHLSECCMSLLEAHAEIDDWQYLPAYSDFYRREDIRRRLNSGSRSQDRMDDVTYFENVQNGKVQVPAAVVKLHVLDVDDILHVTEVVVTKAIGRLTYRSSNDQVVKLNASSLLNELYGDAGVNLYKSFVKSLDLSLSELDSWQLIDNACDCVLPKTFMALPEVI